MRPSCCPEILTSLGLLWCVMVMIELQVYQLPTPNLIEHDRAREQDAKSCGAKVGAPLC